MAASGSAWRRRSRRGRRCRHLGHEREKERGGGQDAQGAWAARGRAQGQRRERGGSRGRHQGRRRGDGADRFLLRQRGHRLWRGAFTDISGENLRKVLSVNLDGAFFTLREAARHMMERAKKGDAGGSLVGVASLAGLEGAGRNEHYGASKGGVLAMVRGIAVEMARYGIRANSIAPGWIATDMTAGAQDSPVFTERSSRAFPRGGGASRRISAASRSISRARHRPITPATRS